MNKLFSSAADALKGVVQDGQLMAVSGFGLCDIPEALIEALKTSQVKNLTVISNNAGVDGFGLGKLLETRQLGRFSGGLNSLMFSSLPTPSPKSSGMVMTRSDCAMKDGSAEKRGRRRTTSRATSSSFLDAGGRVERIFEDYEQVKRHYFRETGIFPIMHTVAKRRDIYEANRWVARLQMKALEE